jgi:septum formation protein
MKNLLKLDKKIVLASKSPRRRELLKMLGLEFEVKPSSIDESKIYNDDPGQYVINIAKAKTGKVAESENASIVIGADTTVYHQGEYLNKPKNQDDAKQMLHSLSGKWHSVYSGICILDTQKFILKTDFCKTDVKFRTLNQAEINAYVESGSPMDKAGAYGIQDDFGAVFVEEIRGDFYNVVGLPVQKLYMSLSDLTS